MAPVFTPFTAKQVSTNLLLTDINTGDFLTPGWPGASSKCHCFVSLITPGPEKDMFNFLQNAKRNSVKFLAQVSVFDYMKLIFFEI